MLLSFCHNCHPFYLGKQITPPVLTDRGPSRPGEQKTALVLTEERGGIDKMLIYTLLLHLSANMRLPQEPPVTNFGRYFGQKLVMRESKM